MRSKEEAHDYRYFPDPDLLPLNLDAAWVAELRTALPELPDARKARFVSQYGLGAVDAAGLTAEREAADYFEAAAAGREAKVVANWVLNELTGRLNREGKTIEESPISPGALGQIIDLVSAGTISGKIAKEVFDIVWREGGDPASIVETRGLRQVSDTGAITSIVDQVLAANPEKAEQAKQKAALLGWFVGEVMKASKGKANPQAVNAALRRKLGL